MKRFLMVLGVVCIGAALYVAAAPGSQQAGPTAAQFAALKKQVTKLQKQVKQAKTGVNFIGDVVGFCMLHQTVGVSQKGDPGGTYGYGYTDAQSHTSFTTALDIASGTPTATLLTLNPNPQLDCASLVGVGGLKHFGAIARFARHH